MISEKKRWVVDAGVGIKLSLPEAYSQEAKDFFSLLAGNPPAEFYVPDLFYVECANILWKYVRRFAYPLREAMENIAALKTLNLRVISTAHLVEKALELALKLEITAYDACYLALAEDLQVPLVTADEKLFKRLKGRHNPVIWIGDFSKKD